MIYYNFAKNYLKCNLDCEVSIFTFFIKQSSHKPLNSMEKNTNANTNTGFTQNNIILKVIAN